MNKLFILTMASLVAFSCTDKKAQLQTLLTEIESKVAPLANEVALAQWNGSVSGNEEDFKKSEIAQQKLTKYLSDKEIFAQIKKFKKS